VECFDIPPAGHSIEWSPMMSQVVPVPEASGMASLSRKLRQHFGFRRFRPGQARAVQAAIEGRDTIVVMPTGSGKSVCFQLPALELEGTTVVVSPLIALMKDQADALREKGKSVVSINSTLKPLEESEALLEILGGRVEFVLATPERLASPDFRNVLSRIKVDLFVVDEAHCASQWGHDFRPEYLALREAIDAIGRPTVLALTATATPSVIDDIRRQLGIADAEVVHMGVDRPNLRFEVEKVRGEDEKRAAIVRILGEVQGTGIIYTATVRAVDGLAEFLRSRGFEVGAYHGKLSARARGVIQDRFMGGDLPIMVATNAFGLGIDKPDIRFVIHHHAPGTIEAYYQEAGRAGRDGLPARCVLLHDPTDKALHRFFQAGRYPTGEDLVNAHHALKRLANEADSPTFEKLASLSPVPRTRLKQALNLFKSRCVVEEKGGELRLLDPDLTPDGLARLAGDYRERNERDLLGQQRMAEFAQTSACRWSYVFDYFGRDEEEESPALACGHCDNCP
jgi:ATP-dependent DNA helicase RecQ